MSFDLKWFTTIPGLLITGGVLFLILALVLLIITGKKSKKEKQAKEAAAQQAADHASQTLGDIQQRLATGQISDVQALREMQSLSDSATQEFVQACKDAIPICKQYAANHPQFEYSGYIENL